MNTKLSLNYRALSRSSRRAPSVRVAASEFDALPTYEALSKPVSKAAAAASSVSIPSVDLPSIDLSGVNPIVVGGIVGGVAVIGGLVALLSGPKTPQPKPIKPETVFVALESDSAIRFIDIRTNTQVREQGSPDLKSIKKTSLPVSFSKVDRQGTTTQNANFGTTIIKKIEKETAVILLDADGTESPQAARELIAEGYTKVFYVQGGAEAYKKVTSLPWKEPSKGFSLDALPLPDISGIVDDFKADPTMTKAALAAAAVVGTSAIAVAEIDVLLQLVGVFAVGQFLFRLIEKDKRDQTFKDISTFVDQQIAPSAVPEDLKKVAKTLLEIEVPSTPAPSSTPAPAASSAADSAPKNVQEARKWIGNWQKTAGKK